MLKSIPTLFTGWRGKSQLSKPINNGLKHTISPSSWSVFFKQIACRIAAILMLISSTFGAVASAGDKPGDAPERIMNPMRSAMTASPAMGYPAQHGNSSLPFSGMFSVSGDIVINDRDSNTLDRYLYRSGSEPQIKIPLNISRYIGDKDKLLAKGLLSKQATISFPGYDIDSKTSPVSDCDGDGIPDQLRPEVNKVYFNGELIGEMTGDNNTWRMQNFSVDISLVNFPSTPGATATNELSIAIDTANENVPLSSGAIGCRVWATEIDWAALQFEAAGPVVLVPGLMGKTDSFENSGYIQALEKEGLPVELIKLNFGTSSPEICAGDGLSMLNQAEVLRQKVSEIAKKYGSESVNLIGHSKGGLDSRAFAHLVRNTEIPVQIGTMSGQPLYTQLKVPSIVTHGSPHQGTALADRLVVEISGSFSLINNLFNDPCALTTYSMEKFNETYPVHADLRVLAIGADADKNGNGVMDGIEVDDHQVFNPIANMWYQLNRHTESIVIVNYRTIMITLPHRVKANRIPETVTTPTRTPELNDGMVTATSATQLNGATPHIRTIGLNHGTILSDPETQKEVIDSGAGDILQWRKK